MPNHQKYHRGNNRQKNFNKSQKIDKQISTHGNQSGSSQENHTPRSFRLNPQPPRKLNKQSTAKPSHAPETKEETTGKFINI